MFDTQVLQEDFGRAAARYDAHAELQRRVRHRLIALGQRCWRKEAQIIDLGCGTGALAREMPDWRITGCDLAYGMCREARKRHSRVITADAAALPFADAGFDGVFSSLMLQWLGEPEKAWRELARIMKPGGYAIIATLAQGSLHELRESFAQVDPHPHVSDFLEAHAILSMASGAGLALRKAEQASIVEYYPDAIALMRSLQAIGATNKAATRKRGLMTLKALSRVEQAYEKRFGQAQGLPATWQVLYLVLEKK